MSASRIALNKIPYLRGSTEASARVQKNRNLVSIQARVENAQECQKLHDNWTHYLLWP